MDWTILAVPGAALVRSIAGWLENGLADGKIDTYEWKLLGSTFVKYVVLGFAFVFGLNLDVVSAMGATILTDVGLNAVKKIGKK